MQDGTYIDEDLLDGCVNALFGEGSADRLRRLYNRMDDLIEAELAKNSEEAQADAAQTTMDELWGSAHEKHGYE